MSNPDKKIVEALVRHLRDPRYQDEAIFKTEFENICGVDTSMWGVSTLMRKKLNTHHWLWKKLHNNEDDIEDIIRYFNQNINWGGPKELARILRHNIKTYLKKNIDSPHLKIGTLTVKHFFINEILKKIDGELKIDEMPRSYHKIIKKIRNNKKIDLEKDFDKMWELYLSEMYEGFLFKGNVVIDQITMKALSNILNHDIKYKDEYENNITVESNNRPDFTMKLNGHNVRIKQLGHSFSDNKQVKNIKKNKNFVVKNLTINDIDTQSIEDQIAEYLLSREGKGKSDLNEAIKSGKTFVLLIKSKAIIDADLLKTALRNQANKHSQHQPPANPPSLDIQDVHERNSESIDITTDFSDNMKKPKIKNEEKNNNIKKPVIKRDEILTNSSEKKVKNETITSLAFNAQGLELPVQEDNDSVEGISETRSIMSNLSSENSSEPEVSQDHSEEDNEMNSKAGPIIPNDNRANNLGSVQDNNPKVENTNDSSSAADVRVDNNGFNQEQASTTPKAVNEVANISQPVNTTEPGQQPQPGQIPPNETISPVNESSNPEQFKKNAAVGSSNPINNTLTETEAEVAVLNTNIEQKFVKTTPSAANERLIIDDQFDRVDLDSSSSRKSSTSDDFIVIERIKKIEEPVQVLQIDLSTN